VRRMAVVRLDYVGERNRLRALRAIHLHMTTLPTGRDNITTAG
jgi:hypothetical protein